METVLVETELYSINSVVVPSGTSDKIGATHRRLAFALCKDDIHMSRNSVV